MARRRKLNREELAELGQHLCDPEAPQGWQRPYVGGLTTDYLIIPGHGFKLYLSIDKIGHIEGFLDDTSG